MYHLGYKTVVINDVGLLDTTSPNYLKIPGFGIIDKLDVAYTENVTVGVPFIKSSIDLTGLGANIEVAIFWENKRYMVEGIGNQSSPQGPVVFKIGVGQGAVEGWAQFEEDFGTNELFSMAVGGVLTAKLVGINIIKVEYRPVPDVSDPMVGGAGFRYNRFRGALYTLAPITAGIEGLGNGTQVEEAVRLSQGPNVDPFATKPHGSQVVELDAVYDVYDYTLQDMDEWKQHENLAQRIPDELVANRPIKYTLYIKQGAASTAVSDWNALPPDIPVDLPDIVFRLNLVDNGGVAPASGNIEPYFASYWGPSYYAASYLFFSNFDINGVDISTDIQDYVNVPVVLEQVGDPTKFIAAGMVIFANGSNRMDFKVGLHSDPKILDQSNLQLKEVILGTIFTYKFNAAVGSDPLPGYLQRESGTSFFINPTDINGVYAAKEISAAAAGLPDDFAVVAKMTITEVGDNSNFIVIEWPSNISSLGGTTVRLGTSNSATFTFPNGEPADESLLTVVVTYI